MKLRERNQIVIERFQERISSLGLEGRLEIYPIENTFTRRSHFMRGDNGTCFFTAFLWQLNKLNF